MSTGSSTDELNVTKGGLSSKEDPHKTQIPIDSKLRFIDTATGNELIHLAVTGTQPPPGFTAKTEYWSRLGPLKTSSITLESIGFTKRPGTEGYPGEFRDWLVRGSVLATAQEASAQQWLEGAYQPISTTVAQPGSTASALFWAIDPDAPSTRRIGLLVECGGAGELLNVTWYKMDERPTDGLIFQKPPKKLVFTRAVVGAMETPSTDPSAIAAQSRWFYYRGVMRPV